MHLSRRLALLPVIVFLSQGLGRAVDLATNAVSAPVQPATNAAPVPATNSAPIAETAPATNSAPNPTPPDTNSVANAIPPPDFSALLAKAQAGDSGAELDVSMAYYNGKGEPKDNRQAYEWSLESAIQGDARGEENVGLFYNKGEGVHLNQVKAFEWYLKAAEHGRATAQRAVGVRYNQAIGTTHNNDAAAAWLRKAATEGEPEAQSRIGYSLTFGSGNGPKDAKKGFAYFMASAASFPYARFLLARCYNEGVFVEPDPVRAYAWGLIAPKQTETQDFLGKLAPKMSVEQIEQATTLSDRLLKQVRNENLQNPAMTATFDHGSSITIKYDPCLDYIVVPFTLQDKEQVNFLIDSGCSISSLDSRVATRFGLTGPNYLAATGIGKDIELSTIADNIHLTGFGLNVSDARLSVLPKFDFDEYLGKPIAGIIGYDILKRFVVHIDYDQRTLTLALPGQFVEDPKVSAVPIDVRENSAFVSATITDDAANSGKGAFLIDTGDDGSTSLTKLFQDSTPKLNVATVTTFSAVGLGGTQSSSFGKATTSIGDIKLDHAIVDLIQDRQGAWSNLYGGIIGEEIWRRFKITLDFPAQKLFLEHGDRFSHPFDFPFCGLCIKTTGGDYKTFVAFQIVADSPAEKVGFQVGDQILQIDKRLTNTMTMDDVYDCLDKEGAHEILYLRDGKNTTVQLPVFDPYKHPEQLALYKKIAPDVPVGSKIESFSVEYMSGAPIYPDDVIIRTAGLKMGDDFLPYTSNRALKKLYATGLFANVALDSETSPTGVKVRILLQPNPVVKTITFTGLTPAEETQLRPQLITEEGVRTSECDLATDADLVRQVLGKNNPADRTVTIDVTGDDGTKRHQGIGVLKSGTSP